MKKFDYIVIQAPMISELGLKGNSLLLFAMIHGFSKDGVNRYRAILFTTDANPLLRKSLC